MTKKRSDSSMVAGLRKTNRDNVTKITKLQNQLVLQRQDAMSDRIELIAKHEAKLARTIAHLDSSDASWRQNLEMKVMFWRLATIITFAIGCVFLLLPS